MTQPPVVKATRGCAAIECKLPVRGDELMCRRHWFMVPPVLRSFLTYRYQPGKPVGRGQDGTLIATAAQAIEHVARLEFGAVRA